jgi:putative transposase
MIETNFKTAPHNPPHWFVPGALYMLTGAIYGGADLIESPKHKLEWRDAFHEAARIYKWRVIAWVVLHNHYHAIIRAPEHAGSLFKFVSSYHKYTARKWNTEDQLEGRKVWWNYWDTCIRSEQDYYNRLKYVFWNPVKHGLVEKPAEYSFSNYGEYIDKLQDFDSMSRSEVNDVPEF